MAMEHDNCPCMDTCPLNRAMALIGGKWKMQILCSLYNNGPTRYNQLKKTLDGVSNTVLANALRELEEDGLVTRREYLEVPVRVEYEHHRALPAAHPHPGRAGQLEHLSVNTKKPRAKPAAGSKLSLCGSY